MSEWKESKLQEVVYHGTNRKFDKFERKHGLDDLSGIEGVDDYYFTDNIKLAKFFAEKYSAVKTQCANQAMWRRTTENLPRRTRRSRRTSLNIEF